ncbi:MAG: ribonuclease III, partial [Oscillospiraceae bacterium]|nr:ribonuclease III [Oscillospiraceae bacterium]
LTRTRALLGCAGSRAEVARRLERGAYLKLGRGECVAGGRERPSIMADAVEAILAAVYLDGGIGSVRKSIQRLILDHQPDAFANRDHKTALQERVQRKSGQVLRYALVRSSGPDHARTFRVEVTLNGVPMGTGEGHSKKEAEQNAAKEAIAQLEQEGT